MKVLDKGFVELIDALGDDTTAARIARISYMSESDPQADARLIDTLMKLGHESPFEHLAFTFHIKAPIFVARQWFRHRMASYNERSGRYTKYSEEFYIPDNLDDAAKQQVIIAYNTAISTYNSLLKAGVRKEQARVVMPLATYTEWYWTVNARSLFNFLNQRASSHAQWEMQQYAKAVAQIFEQRCPITYRAFVEHTYAGDLLENNFLELEHKIDEVTSAFIQNNPAEIKTFLMANHDLLDILKETPEHIYAIFDKVPLHLELEHDIEEGWDELFIIIRSPYPVNETLDKDELLFKEWMMQVADTTQGRLGWTER